VLEGEIMQGGQWSLLLLDVIGGGAVLPRWPMDSYFGIFSER